MARTSSASQVSLISLSQPEVTVDENASSVKSSSKNKPKFPKVRQAFFRKTHKKPSIKRRKIGIIETNVDILKINHSNGNSSLFQTKLVSNGNTVEKQNCQATNQIHEGKSNGVPKKSPAEAARSTSAANNHVSPNFSAWWKPQSRKTRLENVVKNKKNESDIQHQFKLKRKNSKERFTYLGLLIPAMILHPTTHGKDSVTQKFANSLDHNVQLKLAAAHVNDAMKGRGKFGEARAFFKSEYVKRCFRITNSKIWAGVMYLTIAVHCLMMLWEQPGNPVPIGVKWDHWEVNPAVLTIDALCLLIYAVDLALHTAFLSLRNVLFAKEKVWIRLEIVFTIFFIIDFVVLLVEQGTQTRLLCPFRCFRASMLLCKSKNVSHVFTVLLSIVTKLGKVFLIIAIFITTFASVGLHVFMGDYHSLTQTCGNETASWNCTNIYSGAFDHVAVAALHMFVLMSTENYPEFIIPAFNKSWPNFIFFGLYLYVGVFFLTAILLAIIVESYWDYSKRHVKEERRQQREELAKAWNLMDPLGNGQLSIDDTKVLQLFAILKPKNTAEENQELIKYMSMYDDGVIDSYDWTTKLIESLSFVFEDEGVSSEHRTPLCCSLWSKIQNACKRFIHAKATNIAVLVLIILHSILFCLIWSGISPGVLLGIQSTKTAIIAIFVIEVVLRLVADGRELFNIFDVLDILMVLFAATSCIVWYILFYIDASSDRMVHLGACSIVAGVAVLIRAVFNSKHARTAVNVLRNIYPVMFDLILLVITIIFFYAVLGLEILQDKTLSNSVAQGYEGSYVQYGCGVGFETFGCSLLVVFQIVTTNDWHEIMLGAMLDAGWGCVFYFLSCYLIVNMIVMNLFVAISIEAYKKLARDDSATSDRNKIDTTNMPERAKDTSITSAAKTKLGEIFATSRKSRASVGSGTLTGFANSPYAVRRGTLGSIGARTPTPTPRLDQAYLDGETTAVNANTVTTSPRRASRPEVHSTAAESPTLRKLENRQMALKQRDGKRRKQRRLTKQEEKKNIAEMLKNEEQKLQIDGVVRLKRAVRAIRGYNAQTEREMSISEGDVINVSEQSESMLRGPSGWFPANHVVSIEDESGEDNNTGDDANPSPEEKPRVKFDIAPSSPKKVRVDSPRHRASQPRLRKRNDGSEWRRNILGDITVMNKDEFNALRGKFRGGLERRHTSQLRGVASQLSLPISEELHEEEKNDVVPQLTVSEVTNEPERKQEDETTPSNDTVTLTVPTSIPPRRNAEVDKKTNPDGGMPDWVTKFVADKRIMVEDDIKLQERSAFDGESSALPNVVVHDQERSDKKGKSPKVKSPATPRKSTKRKGDKT